MATASWSARGTSRLRRVRSSRTSYFLRDVGEITSVRAIRDEYVNTSQPPASTLVEVSGLFRDDALIEIEAVAIRD